MHEFRTTVKDTNDQWYKNNRLKHCTKNSVCNAVARAVVITSLIFPVLGDLHLEWGEAEPRLGANAQNAPHQRERIPDRDG